MAEGTGRQQDSQPANPPYIVQVRHYSIEQGLPNRTVTEIGQDARGFIWIGTLNNAYRFDGSRFVPLPTKPKPSDSQLPVYVTKIRSDKAGSLWFFKARSKFDQWIDRWLPVEEKNIPFTVRLATGNTPTHFSLGNNISQRGSTQQSHNPLLIVKEDGWVYRYDEKKTLTLLYKSPTPIHLHTATTTVTGSLLISSSDTTNTHYQLIEFDSLGHIRRRQLLPKLFRPVCTDAQGRIYLIQIISHLDTPDRLPRLSDHQLDQLLYRLDPDGQLTSLPIQFSRSPFSASVVRSSFASSLIDVQVVYDAQHDLFWFLGKATLFAWHPAKGIMFDLATSNVPFSQIPLFRDLLVDRMGGVWVASSDGFLLLTLTPNRFIRYLYRPPLAVTGFSDATRGLIQIGHSLLANATDSWLIDLKTGNSQLALSHQKVQKTDFLNQQPVVSAQNGGVWTARSKLALLHPSTHTIEQYPLPDSNNTCWAIWPDGRHNLWLGYNQGVGYFDVRKKQNIPFKHYNNFPELAENRVAGFFPDRQAGGVWVASSSGLYLLDTLRGIVARYSMERPAPFHLPFNHITFVHPDPDKAGLYWLATRGGGLIRWERATGKYKQYTQADGLLNNTLYCLYTDHPDPALRYDKNRLWFTTDYGLVSFNKKAERFQTFLPKDGIAHEEFNFTSNYQAADGRLYLGGLNGVTAFYPNQIRANESKKAPLVVTQLQQLDGKTGDMIDHMSSFHPGQPIRIASSNRALLVSFALLDYRFLGQTRLWYRIRNWQETWDSQPQADLRINGLPPGEYQLDVRMQNNNGQWVSDTLILPIVVEPPIYQQAWFIVLALLILFAAIVTLFRWRSRRLIDETARLEVEVARRTAQIKADKSIIEEQAAKLLENDRLKSRFFANVTHEFRTPLTLLLGPLTYLLKRNTDDTTNRLLTIMDRNARQLQILVNDLLGLGKLEAGQLQLDAQPADMRMVVARTVAAFTTQASFSGITLSTSGLERPMGMLIDVPKLETVLRNIIANALRFTPTGGHITIQLSDANAYAHLSVSDTGSGIHPEDLPYIFERYYQSKRPSAPLQGGTGIGLALCRDYCELWKGELNVTSAAWQGSTFTFTYPKVAVPLAETELKDVFTEQRPVSLSMPPMKANRGREMVLLVEDNADMINYIQTLLAPYYTQHWCRNGREAIEWLNQQSAETLPQLILTDLMMTEMNGIALLAVLREQPTLKHIPVIMLTARVSQDVRLQALQLGVSDYLTKPFDEDELLARVHNLLDRNRERAFWLTQAPDDSPDSSPAVDGSLSSFEDWLQDIHQLVVTHLTDSRFQVNDLAEAANMSQRQFYRRIKTQTGLSPIQFVQEVRLQTAREWLELNRYKTIKEVAFEVGFQKVSYFSRLFQQRFGVSPASMINQ
ncbi:ATP-binding protein [Spirosoma pollinicola]|uniref:histidine kinase n=1 Tax=Spirosoma pollinicola TaxID=2057025 RepID=A0A2K8Z393_9BACT|nr:ATP-binding protein [Spirosoma pollinicola]AUD04294.1 hypothetical protein CWM47_22085 [Spirosoma pollinicola]